MLTRIESPVHVDVVVVGAGLSGLRAAVGVHEAGHSVAVVEAQDRVGGKTFSVDASTPGHGKVELGAAWINDTNQSEMYALAKSFGFDLVEQRSEGENLGASLDLEKAMATRSALHDFVVQLSTDIARAHPTQPHLGPDAKRLDSITLEEYALKHGLGAMRLANVLGASLLGVTPSEVSALFMVDYLQSGTGLENMLSDGKDGGQYLRNRQGNMTFSVRLAEKLPKGSVYLSTPVTRIIQRPSSESPLSSKTSIVETAGPGPVFIAKKVIVSVPTCNYDRIEFDPPLPAAKQALSSQTALGYYAKTVFVFDRPWWREAGLRGTLASLEGPIAFTRDTCVEADEQYSITCFLVGDMGRAWSKWSATERRRQVVEHFDATFGAAARAKGIEVSEPINIIEKEWVKDVWARGAPSPVIMPGTLTSDAGKSLRLPVGSVHFVGTETSTVWKGYMEGAVRSGIRGAKEVVASLKKEQL